MFQAFGFGGTSLASDGDFIPARTAAQVISMGGLGNFDPITLRKMTSGKMAEVVPMISDTDQGLAGGGSPKDLETMFQLIYLTFTRPRADPAIFANFKSQLKAMLANQAASPGFAFNEVLQTTLTQNHLRGRPMTAEMVDQMSLEKSLAFYKERFADASDFTFVFVGSFDLAKIRPLVEQYLGGLPSTGRHQTWKDVGIKPPAGVIKKTVMKGLEPKSQAAIVFTGPFEYNGANRLALRTLAMTLQGNLRDALREEMGGTYGVSVSSSATRIPEQTYTINIGFGCDPARTDELVAAAWREIENFKQMMLNERQMGEIRQQMMRDYETNIRENEFVLSQTDGPVHGPGGRQGRLRDAAGVQEPDPGGAAGGRAPLSDAGQLRTGHAVSREEGAERRVRRHRGAARLAVPGVAAGADLLSASLWGARRAVPPKGICTNILSARNPVPAGFDKIPALVVYLPGSLNRVSRCRLASPGPPCSVLPFRGAHGTTTLSNVEVFSAAVNPASSICNVSSAHQDCVARARSFACTIAPPPTPHPKGTSMSTRTGRAVLRSLVCLAAACVLAAALAPVPSAAPADSTRMLRSPTVSATQIAFAYANNIWVVERAGGRRTAPHELPGPDHRSRTSRPTASGSRSAASTPATPTSTWCRPTGGEPKRLTWHPGARRGAGLDARRQVHRVRLRRARRGRRAARRASGRCPLEGGVEEPMALPRAYQGKISPDGTRVAYRMNNSWDEERRNYRGGQNRPIWIVDLKTYDLATPPWTDSKDMDPAWVGDTVYFISDRDGVANVWAYDTKGEEADAGHEVHRLRREDARRGRGRGGVRAGRLHPRTRSRRRATSTW